MLQEIERNAGRCGKTEGRENLWKLGGKGVSFAVELIATMGGKTWDGFCGKKMKKMKIPTDKNISEPSF